MAQTIMESHSCLSKRKAWYQRLKQSRGVLCGSMQMIYNLHSVFLLCILPSLIDLYIYMLALNNFANIS